METIAINKRYSELSGSECCLSCGGAINFCEVKTGEICVDLGSGRGHDVIRLASEVGNSGFVYGIDIADGMLEKAMVNAQRLGASNVKFMKCELEQLVLPDKTANLVISNCTINHSQDKQAVWNEVHRILKSGGRFVVSDIYATAPVPDEYKNDPVAISECWAGASTREEYLKTLHNAGFSDITILEESSPYDKGKIQVASWTIAGRKKCKCENEIIDSQ